MDMHELHRTEELLHRGLKELNDKGEVNNASLDLIGKTVDAIKDICEIKEDENRSYGGRHGGSWMAEGSYGRMYGDMRYDDRYDRGYEGRDYDRHSYGNNSYGHNQEIVDSLRRDLQNASSEQEREYIRNMIRKYEK